MIQLHDFQQQIVTDLRAVYRQKYRAPLLVAPTGSGKTVMFCEMTRNHIAKHGRVLILVHRQELLEQVSDTLKAFAVSHGFITANALSTLDTRVMVGSVFTVAKRMERLAWRPTLIIVDEAHHAVLATTWGRVLKHYGCHILGVTATPVRLSGEGLGEIFDILVNGPTTQELIARGYLAPFRVFCPSVPDVSHVRKRMGEFNQADLAKAVDRPSITGDVVEHYQRHAPGRQAVAFCVSVEHAHHVADRFRSAGDSAACIDGSLPPQHRREMVRDFKSRQLRVLTSCDLISEGFDCPGIEAGIFLRPTHSLGLWLQQAGRCLRTAPGKNEVTLLDHAGNALRHGLPTELREWDLEGRRSSSGDEERAPTVRVCPKCWRALPSHLGECPKPPKGCGWVFEVAPRQVGKRAGELQEMTPEQVAALRYKETQQDKASLSVLIDLARRRGYKNPEGWAKHVLDGQKAKKTRKARTPEIVA